MCKWRMTKILEPQRPAKVRWAAAQLFCPALLAPSKADIKATQPLRHRTRAPGLWCSVQMAFPLGNMANLFLDGSQGIVQALTQLTMGIRLSKATFDYVARQTRWLEGQSLRHRGKKHGISHTEIRRERGGITPKAPGVTPLVSASSRAIRQPLPLVLLRF